MTKKFTAIARVSLLTIGSVLVFAVVATAQEPLQFISTELNPVQEASAMRQDILSGFAAPVDFQPHDNRALFARVVGGADGEMPGLIGSLHGDFVPLAKSGQLTPMGAVMGRLADRGINREFAALAALDGPAPYYVPWMQATYVMAANRRSLPYLPKGADINALTYTQLIAWGENMKRVDGNGKIGFPAGKGGLMHRFLQGYILPSYSGGVVTGFAGDDAKAMWTDFKALWKTVSTRSLTFDRMDAPLLSNEVWVAWDHTARLIDAVRERPDDFIIFPAPAGPKGRGFMVVLAGLAIPTHSPAPDQAEALIAYLTQPEVQAKVLTIAGFFPVVSNVDTAQLPLGLAQLSAGVTRQASAPDALPILLPVGMGSHSGEFNDIFLTTFSRIVLRGKDIDATLAQNAVALDTLMEQAAAPCWAPDPPSEGPCRTGYSAN